MSAASSLDARVLVLNRSYLPVSVVTARRAFVMAYQGSARLLDEQMRALDFDSWAELSVAAHHDGVGLVDRMIRVPRVMMLVGFNRLPRRDLKLNRHNIYSRDGRRCQYCGKSPPLSELSLDHVIPRSQGGKTTWENLVCCCIYCNRKKGGRRPAEARMRLIQQPIRPNWTPALLMPGRPSIYREWEPFLVNAAYWNAELLD